MGHRQVWGNHLCGYKKVHSWGNPGPEVGLGWGELGKVGSRLLSRQWEATVDWGRGVTWLNGAVVSPPDPVSWES